MEKSERDHVLAVLAEIVPPCELVGAEQLSPEVWAQLWWRDFVLRVALPSREFAIVHEEAKALAAMPRTLEDRNRTVGDLKAERCQIADILSEHGFDLASISVVDAVMNLVRYHEELQDENDRLASLIRAYLAASTREGRTENERCQ